ncbi:hypothetical protein BJV82DRAFT_378513 [Fennellomyces sp. T-0311]|nr:hypothetical protein BJV82DRAFT_378513 [Fennellomyces sp. T-0311]
MLYQSIDDMKELVSQAIPRTSDLVYDIRRLQTVLESKMALYGDNLVQNGLAWKTMGLPVDEQLIATVKGWFYNLCIGLIGELDTECSKLRSLVTDMRELVHHPEGDKLMESIQSGVEFIASVISFIGLPSRKLVYGCRILASIYGQWASENLEFLRETHTKGSTKSMDVKMTNAATTSSGRPTTRVDIRLMQWMDGVVQVLTSLQTLQEVGGATAASVEDDQRTFDSDSLGVLENLASTLVEITVRALSVIETTRRNKHTKQGNIMMNPETALIYMERSVLSFGDRVVEVSGREGIDGPRIQRLHAHLEQNEQDLQL